MIIKTLSLHIVELTARNIHDPAIALNPSNLLAVNETCHREKLTIKNSDCAPGMMFDATGQVVLMEV